ncbi:hypothetical protein RYZ50_03140, partial [Klebsiella pneumoniae]|nr:hypothetical protein [Klebsiella pneumoniae]
SVFTGQIMINHSQFCFRGILWFSHKTAPYSVGCPTFGVQSKSGYWQPAWRPREGMSEHAIRYFREGDIMPVEKVTFVRPRPWPLRDRLVVEAQETVWRRVGEA